MYAHGFLKVACASPKTRLGDAMYNVKEMLSVLKQAAGKKPAIIAFPELCITGYSVGDFLFQKYLYDDSRKAIQFLLDNNPFNGVVIFGSYIIINDTLYNCAFVAQNDKILGIIPKNFLPHTNEFSEARWFLSGNNVIEEIHNVRFLNQVVPFGKILFESENETVIFGTEVCADMWAPTSPNEMLYANGAMIVFNVSASPSYIGKREKRRLLTKSTSLKFHAGYVYVSNNASESTSEGVFSAHKIISEDGKIISEDDEITAESTILYGDFDMEKLHYLRRNNSYFKMVQDMYRDLTIKHVLFELKRDDDFEFEKPFEALPFVPKTDDDLHEAIMIQAHSVLKRLDYVGTQVTVLGVSGGLDSTLALLSLCYAYDYGKIDRKKILTVSLPSAVSQALTQNNAKTLCEKMGVTHREISITEDVKRELIAIGHPLDQKDVTYENIQARFRTYTLMNLANYHKGLVIGTSDMSEVALGWSTFNGDQMAMYGINAGLPKTAVRAVVGYYKTVYPVVADILDSILETPISPELTGSDQKTEDIIGKYEINDFILYHFLANGDDDERIVYLLYKTFGLDKKIAREYVDNFNRRFYSQQYKRLTMPEGAKISEISLSPRTELHINGDMYRPKE